MTVRLLRYSGYGARRTPRIDPEQRWNSPLQYPIRSFVLQCVLRLLFLASQMSPKLTLVGFEGPNGQPPKVCSPQDP